ncbi:hypothetical protein HDV64DRAFT_287689 [Trichoderma sp. TUCIM 5745]
MEEPDGASQYWTGDEDALLYDDGYDWMLDPGHRLQPSNDHQALDAPYCPEYETEPGLSPDSSLQGANFPTPTSIGQNFAMPATPENAFELSNGMSPYNDLNSMI